MKLLLLRVSKSLISLFIYFFRASIDEMRNAAGTDSHVMTATRSNLVENAQPMGLSERPDSNV